MRIGGSLLTPAAQSFVIRRPGGGPAPLLINPSLKAAVIAIIINFSLLLIGVGGTALTSIANQSCGLFVSIFHLATSTINIWNCVVWIKTVGMSTGSDTEFLASIISTVIASVALIVLSITGCYLIIEIYSPDSIQGPRLVPTDCLSQNYEFAVYTTVAVCLMVVCVTMLIFFSVTTFLYGIARQIANIKDE
eukprot:GHVL01014701.1.p1 GENE.GHVL01014701.1~~GHVL01014701.1.p1  ORF type:complete len:192 (+),score=6.13 GHVL01014701.1:25-600(+)